MSEVVRVRVEVYENDQKVAESEIGYYAGQDYTVKVDTPDGTDVSVPLTAGTEKA